MSHTIRLYKNILNCVGSRAMISESLWPWHGASSGCGWRNDF